ncbi:POLG alternative reading frame-like [Dasypus novemcinctus]|uniref:POLG alternative reading frame-like n=1 Tax=Dasypus novemcinctus TaxID=9361 RepID=UPI0039C97DE0
MAAGTEEGHGRARPGVEPGGGRLLEVGWDRAVERWGGRRAAAAAAGEEPVASGRAEAARSSGLDSAFARLSAAARGEPPSASARALAAAAAARSRRRRAHKAPPAPAPRAPPPPPPNPPPLIGRWPRRLPGNAVPVRVAGDEKEEEPGQGRGEEGPGARTSGASGLGA